MANIVKTDLLKSRIQDAEEIVYSKNIPKFIGFLSTEEIAYCEKLLTGKFEYSFFGGSENSVRKMLGIFPSGRTNISLFPITAVKVSFNSKYQLTHRDFLGSLMALNIKRETVGDIFITNGTGYIVLSNTVTDIVLSELKKIGSVGVKAEQILLEDIVSFETSVIAIRTTVSSLRSDAVVSAIIKTSREKSLQYIKMGYVAINSEQLTKPTKTVTAGDCITVRGFGKFKVESCDSISKKGKIILNILKYN